MRRVLGSPVTRVSILLVLLALACWQLVHRWPTVHPVLQRLDAATIVGATVLGIVPVVAGALSWRALLAGLDATLPMGTTLESFSIGQLGKYLPGSVWPVVVQGELARTHGVRRDRAITASLLAMGMSLAAALLVAAVALPAQALAGSSAIPGWADALLVAGALAVLVVMHPPVLTRLVNLGLRLLRREPLPAELPRRTVAFAFGWAVLGSLSLGVHAWLLARGLGPVGFGRGVGGFLLAWVAGFVVPLAPGGAGVREVVLAVVFAGPLGRDGAVALAAVSRLLLTVVDLAAGGLAALTYLRHRGGAPSGSLSQQSHEYRA